MLSSETCSLMKQKKGISENVGSAFVIDLS